MGIRYNKHLTNLVFPLWTVSYGTLFDSLQFMSRVLRTGAMNWRKNCGLMAQLVEHSTGIVEVRVRIA